MKRTFSRLVLTVLLASAAACAAYVPQDGTTRRDPDRIIAQELQRSSYSNAFEVVQRLRPSWLRKRGASSIYNEGAVVIYYDQVRMGGPEALRQIPVNALAWLEFLDASSATQRWGTGHVHGAIVVHTVSGGES